MKIRLLSSVVGLMLLSGCAAPSGHWTWVPAQESGAEDLSQAISDCEEYARDVDHNGNLEGFRNARPYGGWGNFSFETCMNRRGWELQYLPRNISVAQR